LTLGVVLTLGAVTGGRGQELSGAVTEASAPSATSWGGFALPSLPGNWADLPFRLTASQSTSYNSNINALPLGFATPPGVAKGDFTTTTNLGFSTKANVFAQQLYFDATFGLIRYRHQTGFDSNVYTVSAGDNWTLTSRCSGNIGVTLSKAPAAITELVASGVNYLTATALNETGRCAISNGYSVVFNSSLTQDTNSNPIDAVNNVRATMLEAGIEYSKGPNTLTALAGITDTTYPDRNAATAIAGLAAKVDFHTFSLNYTRVISPSLSVSGIVGLVGVTNAFTLGLPKTLLPIYTLSLNWAFTPKLSLTASGSRTVAPPTTVIANAEVSYDATLNLTYLVTPKVGLTLGGSAGYSTGAFTPAVTTAVLSPFFAGASNFYSANAGLTYTMTPFLSAGLSASYTERVTNHQITPQNLVMVNLNYRPY
jgi:Putative beta-barrel porin 2